MGETRAFGERVAAAKREIRGRSIDGIERRTVATNVELRAAGADWFRVVGHGAVFNSLSENLGGFREVIDPGFFDGVLADDVRALFNHDPNLVLARRKIDGIGGFAVLEQDARGLAYDFEPTRTSYAIDLRANLEAGVVDQSSFAFRVGRGGEEWTEDEETGALIRRLLKGGCSALFDVSPVTYPAYPAADSGIAAKRDAPVPIADGDRVAESFDDLSLGRRGTVTATYADPDDGAIIHDVKWDDDSTSEGVRSFSLRRLDVPPLDRERNDGDEAARQRPADGPAEDEQADEFSERKARAERLRLRIGEPRL